MMLEFAITNLILGEDSFKVPSALGFWNFKRVANYKGCIDSIEQGMCGNTFLASIDTIDSESKDADFEKACNEIIDICFTLSFLNANCVTVSKTTEQSDIQFLTLGDNFIRPRGIVGFLPLLATPSIAKLFSNWLTISYPYYQNRQLRLLFSHWLSGLTCFSLEDIFLSAGVQMDLVRQHERRATGNIKLNYFKGMESASRRYSLVPLGADYKRMRNDIVHEGVLSGSNFSGKTKIQCAQVIADTLNWIDTYVLAILGVSGSIINLPRWESNNLAYSLPAILVR